MLFRLNAVLSWICNLYGVKEYIFAYLYYSSHHRQFYSLWLLGIVIFAVFFFCNANEVTISLGFFHSQTVIGKETRFLKSPRAKTTSQVFANVFVGVTCGRKRK